MPTFNQLVRKGRQTSEKKSTAPALQKGYNSLQKRAINASCYAEEAELSSQKDRQGSSFQWNRSDKLYPGRGT